LPIVRLLLFGRYTIVEIGYETVIKTVIQEMRHSGRDCHYISYRCWVFNYDCFCLMMFYFVSEHNGSFDTFCLKVQSFFNVTIFYVCNAESFAICLCL